MIRAKTTRLAGILMVFAAAAVLGACGKDSSGPDNGDGNGNGSGTYYYRFDANGTRVTFNTQNSLTAAFSQSGNQRLLLVTGYNAQANSAVTIYSGAAISTGTYSGYTIDVNAAAVIGVTVHYQDASGTVYQSDNTTTNLVNIVQVTTTTVHGTFAGRLKAAGKADLVITNGEFVVPRVN